jgi:predicted ATPase
VDALHGSVVAGCPRPPPLILTVIVKGQASPARPSRAKLGNHVMGEDVEACRNLQRRQRAGREEPGHLACVGRAPSPPSILIVEGPEALARPNQANGVRRQRSESRRRFRSLMHISKFQITNYKSYRDSGEIELQPGFNILTGQNSAGKTALLEALTLQFTPTPHVSDRTVPFRGAPPDPTSSGRITFVISGAELVTVFRNAAQRSLPRPKANVSLPSGRLADSSPGGMNLVLREMAGQLKLPVSVHLDRRADSNDVWTLDGTDVLGMYEQDSINPHQNMRLYYPIQLDQSANLSVADANPGYRGPDQDLRLALAQNLRNQIYRFWAERFIVGLSAFGTNSTLTPNATNLPEVLNVLDGNTARFERLNTLMREVLPQVRHISVRPFVSNQVQILVWPIDYATEKDYLAIPLNECGSGVAQVLAILYVVVTSEHPQTIIVDEPQSFLHPGAVRKLIEVLKRYPQHQYIFATHAPNVITASDPTTVTIVRSTDDGTKLQAINPRDSGDLKLYLREIGARLSDVFGADDILWVEGETEEECIPRILSGIAGKSLMGTAIVGIRQTGDFSGRDRKKVLELYRRLSQSNTLLPPALGFIFDQECLSPTEKADLERMGQGLVHFLPCRMYENYLLLPAAIAAVASSIDGFRENPLSEDEVRRSLEEKRQDLRYFCKGTRKVPADWVTVIDGASVLGDIFREMSESRVEYRKTSHSVALTDWLIQNNPEAFKEIAQLVTALLPA